MLQRIADADCTQILVFTPRKYKLDLELGYDSDDHPSVTFRRMEPLLQQHERAPQLQELWYDMERICEIVFEDDDDRWNQYVPRILNACIGTGAASAIGVALLCRRETVS